MDIMRKKTPENPLTLMVVLLECTTLVAIVAIIVLVLVIDQRRCVGVHVRVWRWRQILAVRFGCWGRVLAGRIVIAGVLIVIGSRGGGGPIAQLAVSGDVIFGRQDGAIVGHQFLVGPAVDDFLARIVVVSWRLGMVLDVILGDGMGAVVLV